MAETTLTEIELRQFTGSETSYRHRMFPGYHYTEGVRYVAERAGAYWLIDSVFSHQTNPLARQEPFQVWTLSVLTNRRAALEMSDGNTDRAIIRQDIEFTDFPLDQIRLYFVDRLLMLPSEY